MNEHTHVAIPVNLYKALSQLLMSMPYGQVKEIIDTLNAEALGVTPVNPVEE